MNTVAGIERHVRVLRLGYVLALCGLVACASAPDKIDPPRGHIGSKDPAAQHAPADDIPPPVTQAPTVPEPEPRPNLETYTVVVNQVPVKELLFALARDAELNLDIHDDIEGTITLNAIDQTLPQILKRIARQSDVRYRVEDDSLIISADAPYLETYKVPYVNMSRDSSGQISLSTQVAASGTGDVGGGGGGRQGGGNNSSLSVQNSSIHDFWRTLYTNVAAIVGDPAGAANSRDGQLSGENISVNREAGLISVRATSKEHDDVRAFIDEVVNSTQRQVLIEATVVEVNLDKNFQAGIDWSRVAANEAFDGFSARQRFTGIDSGNVDNLSNPAGLIMTYTDAKTGYSIASSLRLLEQFGDVSVLSSPKVMALNNQTSVLKVVDSRVYFTTEVDITTNDNTTRETFETNVHTVPVGLVMSMVPYISESDEIILNIRPTISRVLRFVNDPNPLLEREGVESAIPEIQVREMESVLRLNNGQVAVIGGLMQDSVEQSTDAVPGLSRIPVVGEAFKKRNNRIRKTELVIFLRPTVIREPSLEADLKGFRPFLPDSDTAKQ